MSLFCHKELESFIGVRFTQDLPQTAGKVLGKIKYIKFI